MDRVTEARIDALEAEIKELRKAISAENSPPTSDRRGMIKLVAATAVGAVTGAALLGAEPAAAADGGPMMLGQENQATLVTSIVSTNQSALGLAGGSNGVGLIADGNLGNAWFVGGGGSPAGTAAFPGMLWVDGEGNWWGSTVDSDTDGRWIKLAGPGTAGQLHVLPTPVRVYDSRPGQGPPDGIKSPTASNEVRVIETTAANSGVPFTANAVLVNLTITGPQAPGFASAWPTGPWPGTSSVNFAAGQDIAATTVVGCGLNATIQILSNTVTNFLIDVIGYYQ